MPKSDLSSWHMPLRPTTLRCFISIAATLSLVGCKGTDNTGSSPVVEPNAQEVVVPVANAKLDYKPVPAGTALADTVRVRFAIYFLPTPTIRPEKEFKRLVRSRYSFLSLAPERESGTTPFAVVGAPDMSEFAPPTVETLKYIGRGLSPEDRTAVQASQEAWLVDFSLSQTEAASQHREVMKLMAELAKKTGGLLWDESTRQLFSHTTWADRYADWDLNSPKSWSLYTIHSYQDGELQRVVSLGLEKFGLPDIAVRDVSRGDTVGMTGLINLVAQTLRSGAKVDEDGVLVVDTKIAPDTWELLEGGKGTAKVILAVGERLEGDADNRLWEIVFPGGPESETQSRQQAFLHELFGATDEIVHSVHDEELKAASRLGLVELGAMKEEFQTKWPVGDTLLVKSPFDTDDGGTEWMWIEVVSWQGEEIKGILQNEPFSISDLKAGARVESRFDLLFDYIRHHADGTTTGNGTGVVLSKRE